MCLLFVLCYIPRYFIRKACFFSPSAECGDTIDSPRRRAIIQGKHVDGGRWRCKSSGRGCNVAMEKRIECKICRLNACLRAGMRTDLVLDDKGKAFRFRSFLQKQAGGGPDNNGRMDFIAAIRLVGCAPGWENTTGRANRSRLTLIWMFHPSCPAP